MAKQCDVCGKSTVFGKNVSHAHNVTSRTWEPNLQRVRALVDGRVRRIAVCTRCLRSGRVVKAPARNWQPEEQAGAGASRVAGTAATPATAGAPATPATPAK